MALMELGNGRGSWELWRLGSYEMEGGVGNNNNIFQNEGAGTWSSLNRSVLATAEFKSTRRVFHY